MAPKGKEKKQVPTNRPPFEYTPVHVTQYQRYINLTVKLISWSYLNFTVRIPVTTTLGAIKQLIINQNKQSLTKYQLRTDNQFSIADNNCVMSGVTDYDLHILNTAVSNYIRLYKGSPMTFPVLVEDDEVTLEDVGFVGSTEGDRLAEADIFYDFGAARIIGNGKQRF